MKKTLFLILGCLYAFMTSAQTDTEFWFAAPELVTSGSGRVTALKFVFVTYNDATEIRISQPANSYFDTITLTVPASSYAEHDFISQRNTCVEIKPQNTFRILNHS